MLRRTGGGLVHDGGESGAAALGDDDAVGTGALGRADDGPQVVGVADLIADDDEGRLLPLLRQGQNIADLAVFPHTGQGNDPLVGMGLAHKVQLAPVGLHHHNALLPGLGGDVPQGLVHIALGDEDFVNGPAGPQGLNDRVAAFYNIVFDLVISFYHVYCKLHFAVSIIYQPT